MALRDIVDTCGDGSRAANPVLRMIDAFSREKEAFHVRFILYLSIFDSILPNNSLTNLIGDKFMGNFNFQITSLSAAILSKTGLLEEIIIFPWGFHLPWKECPLTRARNLPHNWCMNFAILRNLNQISISTN